MAQIEQTEIKFWRDPRGNLQRGPHHLVHLPESLPAIDGEWMHVMPHSQLLVDAHRIFPSVVAAYELACFHLSVLQQTVKDQQAEIESLRDAACVGPDCADQLGG